MTGLLDKWRFLQAAMVDLELSAGSKVLLARLLHHHNGKTGRCDPSYSTLARAIGRTRRNVIRAVQELERGGWVTIDRPQAAAGGRLPSNGFGFSWSRSTIGDENITSDKAVTNGKSVTDDENATGIGDKIDHGIGDKNVTQTHEERTHEIRTHESLGGLAPKKLFAEVNGYVSPVEGQKGSAGKRRSGRRGKPGAWKAHPEFLEWYRQYPRHVAPERAFPTYLKIIEAGAATHAELKAGAMRYAAERTGQEQQYTKHPATWLTGGCWADEPSEKPRKQREHGRSYLGGLCGNDDVYEDDPK